MPLGGTSNHLRGSALDDIGAWDPFNFPEAADLGVRIAESGYRTAVLNSTTLEDRQHWRRPTATRSTGFASDHAGTRATCKRGWCTCASR